MYCKKNKLLIADRRKSERKKNAILVTIVLGIFIVIPIVACIIQIIIL
ncbi:MAG: hypothetical protein Q4G05_04700 [Clostridia bacterium]|nr:hypothetical protein [Clostridia bacterium]